MPHKTYAIFFLLPFFSLHSVLLLFLQMAPPFPLSDFLFQQFSHRLYSINSFVYSSFGYSNTSRVSPCSTIFPCRMTITRLQSSPPAQGRGRSTASQVLLPAAVFSAVEQSAPVPPSSALVASSQIRRDGCTAEEPAQLRLSGTLRRSSRGDSVSPFPN